MGGQLAMSNFLTCHREGGYGQDYFTLRSIYFQGRPPKSVNMYWRRFATADIPTDAKDFDAWITERWREKDQLMKQHHDTGRFPMSTDGAGKPLYDNGYIDTDVRLRSRMEIPQMFTVLFATALLANVLTKLWAMLSHH